MNVYVIANSKLHSKEDFSVKVMITCPAGSGALHFYTLQTVINMQGFLDSFGYSSDFKVTSYEPIIQARNDFANDFLNSEAEILIGIDDDVGLEMSVFGDMFRTDFSYIGVCVPQRQLDLSRFAECVREGHGDREAQRIAAPLVDGPGLPDGISVAKQVCTSFFMLKKDPLKKLIEENAVPHRTEKTPDGEKEYWGFYDLMADDTGKMLSEDYSFCKRIRDLGFNIHAYKGEGVSHSGEITFHS